MNELVCIQAFVAIVESGSQLRAAKKLHQTNAAINKKLARLEEKLGIRLLERDSKSSQLTPSGQRYYIAYKELLEKLNDIEEMSIGEKAKPQGRLMVTLSRSMANIYIVPRLKKFTKLYPDIFIVLDIAEKNEDFVPTKQDILIAPDSRLHENLVRKKFITTRDILCASHQYLKNKGFPKRLAALQQLDYVGHCSRAPINTIELEQGRSIDIKQPLLRVNDDNVAIQLALQHLGFIYIKEYQVQPYLKSERLIEILPHLNKRKVNIAFHYHYQTYLDPRINAFIKFFST